MRYRENFDLAVQEIARQSRKDSNGCVLWQGNKNSDGYGIITVSGKSLLVHRVMYAHYIGDPSGLSVCHSCDVRNCVNPEHLWLGTKAENNHDRHRKGRTRNGVYPSRNQLSPDELKGILSKLNVTQQQFGDLHGVSRQTVNAWLAGRHRIPDWIANAYDRHFENGNLKIAAEGDRL